MMAQQQELAHHRAGRLGDAIADYDAILAIDPHRAAALVNKGAALRRLDRLPEAMACYWRALAIDPGNAHAWCNAGGAFPGSAGVPPAP